MSAIILLLSLLFTRCRTSFPRCPYPLAETIEPFICQVVNNRMELTLQSDMENDRINRVEDSFDHNKEIHRFEVSTNSAKRSTIRKYLSIGKLNITHYTMSGVNLQNYRSGLFQQDSFAGSAGSIESISVQNVAEIGSVYLNTAFLHPAGPTLKSLKLERANYLSSKSFSYSPNLVEVSFQKSLFYKIPPQLFVNVTNINMISIQVQKPMIIETDAFKDLKNLTKLDISSLYKKGNSKIEGFAFNNLPNLKHLQFDNNFWMIESFVFNNMSSLKTLKFTGNVMNIKEDACKDLTSLIKFEILQSEIKELPRILSNCTSLETFTLRKSEISVIAANAFSGFPLLKTLDLSGNKKLTTLGLGSSIHVLNKPEIKIMLDNTNVRSIEKFVFYPLLETFANSESSSGYISLSNIVMNCGCDVKWIVEDFYDYTHFFKGAQCVGSELPFKVLNLKSIDALLLETWCPK